MRHIVGKLSTSSFQRYKVCANRSSDEGVMAPGSRGIGAVFVHSSGEDSDQTGDAFGEPRVPRRSRSHYLSNAPGLADQLVASRKDSAREGGSCAAYFCKVPDSRESELGLVRYGPASRVHRGVFGPFEGSFPIRIPADPDKFLAIREFHVVHGCVLFPMCPGSQINLLRVRKTLCASAATSVGKFRKFQHSLISSACFHARGRRSSRCRISDDLVLATTLSFLVRFRPVKYGIEALDILYTLVKGWSVRSSFWSGQRSGQTLVKLGQPWSNLVGFGQSSPNSWKCIPGLHFKGFWARRTLVGLETARSNLGQTSVNPSQTWSTLVKLGQTLGNVSRTFFLGVFDAESPRRIRPAWFGLSRFARRHSRKSRGPRAAFPLHFVAFFPFSLSGPHFAPLHSFAHILLSGTPIDAPSSPTRSTRLRSTISFRLYVPQFGLDDHPSLKPGMNRGRIGLGDHPGLETKFVIRVRIGLGDHPGLETETNRGRIGLGDHPGLETKFVIRVRIGLGDHPGLETETNRGRIGLGDHPGLETKFVIRVRIGLGDHPGLETETNRGRIGLGDHPGLETKFVIRVRIGLGDHPGLETETNRGRIGLGDHPGLETKFVIRVRIGLGDHPGLETETNRGRIGLGDHPGLETKFVIRVRIGLGDHPGLETETNRGRIGLGDHPGLETKFVIRVRIGLGDHPGLETETNRGRIGLGDHPGLETKFVIRHFVKIMSDRGSGSGGHRRSDRLAKGKAVAYAPESSPDTDDEYDAMEDVRTRVDASLARDLQAEFDAEAAGSAPSAARAPPRPGVVIGRSAGPSETTRPSPQPSVTTGSSDAPPAAPRRAHTRSTGILPSRLKRQRSEGIPDSAGTIPEDYVAPGFRYPPHGGIRPRYPVAVEISDTPLLTNLLAHPSSLVRRCQEPPYSAGRGGCIPYVSVYHPAVWCFIERFFHHTGTFHLSTCEMAVLPVDWSAILGIRFGGRAPPSEPIDGFEAREILGLADHDATEGTRRPSVRIRYLADVLRRDREEPPTELRYRQWAAYFIFSCFLGNDRSIVPTPIVGMFRDIDTLREYDWGALTYGFYIRGLRRYSRRESISFLGFWQFTVFWAFEHFPTFAPSRLPLASDPDFPLARRWDTSRIERMTTCTLLELRMTVDCLRDADIIFQPYSAALSQRPEVFRAVALSRLRLWIRTTRSWELLLGERTVRQLGDEAVVPVDPSPLMTIEDYIPRAPSDPYIAGVSAYPSLVREGVPYQEWFEQVSLGSLMSLHEVEGGRVMGGVAMDSHHIRSSGQIERLEGEVLRLQLELSVSADRYTADMDRVQGEMASMQTEATRREGEMVQMQRDLASRDAEVTRLAAAVRRLEDQLHGMGITPVTGADLSGPGQPSSSPPRDPVSRDWFFDDPSPP
uniref:Aminotransferase-like plant mobile domain-containing protein n=2 Tax=Fagus sylvatica TaxID=28930 RepID=A0A2N9ES65_FAGSY